MKRKNSLKNKQDFNDLFKNSKKTVSNLYFVIKWSWRDDKEEALLGIAVSKKTGNAVNRNRVKREVRIFVDNYINLQKSANIIIIVKLKYNYMKKEERGEAFKVLISKTPFKIGMKNEV